MIFGHGPWWSEWHHLIDYWHLLYLSIGAVLGTLWEWLRRKP